MAATFSLASLAGDDLAGPWSSCRSDPLGGGFRNQLRNNQLSGGTASDPASGRIRLSELTGRHITDMITTIGAATNWYGRTSSPSTLHRIRATPRLTLNAAIRDGLLRDNPAIGGYRCVPPDVIFAAQEAGGMLRHATG